MKKYTYEQIVKMTSNERLEALKEDFLERDGESYVFISKGPRAGWESLLKEGESLTDFNVATSGMELLKKAYALAQMSVSAMLEGRRMRIQIIPESNQSFTNGKTVNVATEMLDDTSMTKGQRADVFRGKAIHETCHIKWTDFDAMSPDLNAMERSLLNIIEDERIERICGETYPGYAGFLAASKRDVMNRYYKKLQKEGAFDGQDDASAIVNAVIHMVRFPKSLTDEEILRWGEPLLRIRNLMVNWPTSTTEVVPMAIEAYRIILEYLKTNENQKPEQNKQNQQEKGRENQPETDSDSNGTNQSETPADSNPEQELEKIGMVLCRSIAEDPNKELTDDDMSVCITESEDAFDEAGELQGNWRRGSRSGRVIHKPVPDKDTYVDSYHRVKKWVPMISEKMKNMGTDKSFVIKGQRNGMLDTCRLAEGYQGIETIYMTTGMVKANKIAVTILMDESGSMHTDEKMHSALDATVLIAEACKRVPNIQLNIFSYTDDEHSLDLTDYGDGRRGELLGGYNPGGGTPTAEAIDEAVKITRQRTSEKGILVVVTDGAAQNTTEELESSVKAAEQAGLSVIAVGIEFKNIKYSAYKNAVNFDDMNSFAPNLGKMIRAICITIQKK